MTDAEQLKAAIDAIRQMVELDRAGLLPPELQEKMRLAAFLLFQRYLNEALQTIQAIAVNLVRKFPHTDAVRLVGALVDSATDEAQRRVLAETGIDYGSLSTAIPVDWLERMQAVASRRPTREAEVTAAEHMAILEEFYNDWWSKGFTQTEYARYKRWNSRTPLTRARAWYERTYGRVFVVSGNKRKQKKR